MISVNLIWGISLATIAISFVVAIILALLNVKKVSSEFSILNHFPFETIKDPVSTIFFYIFAASLFSPLLFIIPNFGEAGDTAVLNIVFTCLFGLSGLAIVATIKIKLIYPKEHVYCSTALISAGFLMPALSAVRGFISFNLCKRFGESGGLYIALAILSTIIALAMLAVTLNPKLKDWAMLDTKIDGDVKTYQRPKVISLAYSEWAAILSIFISAIIFLFNIISF